jgi:hypothetical protein
MPSSLIARRMDASRSSALGSAVTLSTLFIAPTHLSLDPGPAKEFSIVVQQLVLLRTPFFMQSECDSRLKF